MGQKNFNLRVLGTPLACSWTWNSVGDGIRFVPVAAPLGGPAPGEVLQLAGVGSSGVTAGFSALGGVDSYTATADRFRLASTGFVRCAANEERLCYNSDGTFRGQYLQGADSYNSAPWDDVAAPHTASDPAYLTTSAGGTIAYAGAHSEADIFGGTGKGVVITQTATTNGFFTASAIPLTSVVANDLMRFECILAITGASVAGEVTLGTSANGTAIHTFQHDASGNITGQTEAWATRRAGFHDMGIINGKRWWYLFVDARATNTNNATFRIGFGSGAAQVGKKYHICELMGRKNPATAPAAVPVCKANATFAADTLNTGFADAGWEGDGLCISRSQLQSGAIAPPALNIGVPYEPLETRITIVTATEAADRFGPRPNPNILLYGRAWRAPTSLALTYGSGWFPQDWVRAGANSAEAATTVTVRSVFQTREDKRPILGNLATSQSNLTNVDIDGPILMQGGDTRTKYMEQSDVLNSSLANFFFAASGNVSFTNGLALGSTLWPTRARHLIQQDDDTSDGAGAKSVYMGELVLQTSGGALSLKGSRYHNMARVATTGATAATSMTLDTDDTCATQFWMDGLAFISRGTYTNWTGARMFGAGSTGHTDMFFCQSERPIRISTNSGGTWGDLSTSFDVKTMPHGFLAEHVGTYDFDTSTFTAAPDPDKALRVRYWVFDSIASPAVQKPGFQWLGSQMDMGTHTRVPVSGDVFRIKNGTQWIDVTYQGGQWESGGYVRSGDDNSVNNTAAISNDFIQIDRTNVTMQTSVMLDGCVFMGPKGAYFLTGDPPLGATGSNLDNFTVQNSFVMSFGTNALRWDHSRVNPADCLVQNVLIMEAASDFTYTDGTGDSLSSGGAGARNVLTFGSNVTVMSSSPNGGGILPPQNSATYVNDGAVVKIATGRRSAYDTFSAPDAKVAQYLPTANFDAVQGRAIIPSYADIWDFNLTAFADTDAGFGVRAVITAAKGTHARWNAVIADLKAKFHKVPDLVVTTANTASVGTNLGAATGVIDRIYGGDIDRLFEVVSGQLQVRRALTGINRVFMMRTTTGQLLIVDVTA